MTGARLSPPCVGSWAGLGPFSLADKNRDVGLPMESKSASIGGEET